MTEATMRGILRFVAVSTPLLATLAFTTACPSGAQAQTTTTGTGTGTTTTQSNQAIDSNLVVRRNGDIIKNGTIIYGTVADCGGENFPDKRTSTTPNSFEFSATYTTNVPVVEAWLGVGSGENCAAQASRLRSTTNGSLPPICTFLGSVTTNTRNPKITVPGNQLFNQTTGRTDPTDGTDVSQRPCDKLNGGQTYTVYFLPLSTQTTNVNATDPITVGVLSTLKAVFTPYTRRPDAPTGLNGQSGETELGVTFKAPSSSMTLTKYKAYFDVNNGMGGGVVDNTNLDAGIDAATPDATVAATADDGGVIATVADAGVSMDAAVGASTDHTDTTVDAGSGAVAMCGSGVLVGTNTPPVNVSGIRETKTSSSTSVKLTDLTNVDIDQNVAVAAVSIDPAGNESTLSNPICVQRVNTTGFLDACDNQPGCRKALDSCSLNPGRSGSAWGLSMFALALTALVGRRKRAHGQKSEEGRA